MKGVSFWCIAFATCAAVGVFVRARATPAQPIASITIAVAPFERIGQPGVEVPDVGTLLADRIGTQGVGKVVGPGEFSVEADAEPDDETIRAWAKQVNVATVVVGRVTRIGTPVSVDVRLRSGETGAVVGTYVAEILSDDRLATVVDGLAREILDGLTSLDSAGASGASPAAPAQSKLGRNALGIYFDSGRPLSIRADQLESVESAGVRRLLFTQNVVVTQDDLTIRSNRLEAFYPANTNQPDRMVASGRVRMSNGEKEARCDEATYERGTEMLICRGNAELRGGSDCVSGNWIEFDLAAETVKVGGGARVVIGGENGAGAVMGGTCQ